MLFLRWQGFYRIAYSLLFYPSPNARSIFSDRDQGCHSVVHEVGIIDALTGFIQDFAARQFDKPEIRKQPSAFRFG